MLVLLLKKFSTPHFPGRRVAREMFEQKNNCVIACGSPEMNMFLPTDQQQCGLITQGNTLTFIYLNQFYFSRE